MIPVPDKSENLYSFFQTLEHAFALKNVPDVLNPEILIKILREKLNNILDHLNEVDIKSYETSKRV